MKPTFTFDEIYQQNQNRIHYHIHKLQIKDLHQEFYQIGLQSLWQAYQKYEPQKGPMSTYFNYIIRNRLIDQIRKEHRHQTNNEKYLANHPLENLHFNSNNKTINDLDSIKLHQKIKSYLTNKQWKWFKYCVVNDKSLQELAIQENTTIDAVKSWSRQARRNLRTEEVQKMVRNELEMT